MPGVKVPADIELEDRLAFGLTGQAARDPRRLGGGGLRSRGRARRRPARAARARGRRARRPRRPRARVPPPRRPRRRPARPRGGAVRARPTPAGARSRGPCRPAPRRPAERRGRTAPAAAPRILASGVVELGDGSHCLLLAARGSGFELRAAAEQAAFVAAFARFLNGLSEPLQIVVQSERISLTALAERLEQEAATRTAPLRAAARSHAAYLRSLGSEAEPLRRRRIVLVLRASGQPATAAVALARAADQAGELLAAAAVELTPLSGEEAAALLARSLDPPGPGAGVQLTGTIRAAA